MPWRRKIPFALIAFVVFAFSALEFAAAQCAIKPIKPIPPLGCKDVTPQCVTTSNGQSYWTWICVPDSAGGNASGARVRQVPPPEPSASRAADQNSVQTAPANAVVLAPQTHVPISEDSKPAVETLRIIAQRIGECPKALISESQWGRKKDEIERLYQQPPANLIWDAVAGNSVRAPYLGYIEFTVNIDYWVPESAERNFLKWPGAAPTLKYVVGPWHYRYEYDLGPDGLQLIRALMRNRTTGEWVEPTRDALAKDCWDTAARDTQAKANASPDQGALQDNTQSASQWFASLGPQWQASAEQGDPVAQYNLGASYEGGHGVPQDYAKAAMWYRKAAEQGHAAAQYSLGMMYSHGQGVQQDYTQAAYWWRKAAEQNYANAQFYLGLSYGMGQGVRQDNAEAYFWVTLAVSSQRLEGVTQEDVSSAVSIVTSGLKPADQTNEQERMRKWLEEHPTKPQ
jgi:Sel1 repeat